METARSTFEVPIMEDGHNFFKVSRTRGFVDKSLLIETAFKHDSRMLITAPSKFCKSTNLHMMKCFLSDRSDQKKCEIFKSLDIQKRSKMFYKQHIHKYKVVFVDLTSGKSASYSDALDAYRWAIHNTFLEHDYLLRTSVLKSSEEKIFSSWCDMNQSYKTKQKKDMVNDLSLLVEVLARQSGSKVIVLVDEYDNIINKAIYEGHCVNEFNDICDLTSDILQSLLKDNTILKIAIVTGLACVTARSLYKLKNLVHYPFLGSHEFCRYFTLLEDELKTLLERNDFKEHLPKAQLLGVWYNSGYTSFLNSHVLNLFSVLNFLKSNKYYFHWKVKYQAEKFVKLSLSPNIARLIHRLLLCGTRVVNLKVNDLDNLYQLGELRMIYSHNTQNIFNTDILCHHLHEVGLLNFKDQGVRLPNCEIYTLLSYFFRMYIIQNCNLPTQYLQQRSYKEFTNICRKTRLEKWSSLFSGAKF